MHAYTFAHSQYRILTLGCVIQSRVTVQNCLLSNKCLDKMGHYSYDTPGIRVSDLHILILCLFPSQYLDQRITTFFNSPNHSFRFRYRHPIQCRCYCMYVPRTVRGSGRYGMLFNWPHYPRRQPKRRSVDLWGIHGMECKLR